MPFSSTSPHGRIHPSLYMKAFLVLLTLHAMMQFVIPAFGDEAYFISWGKVLSLGVYDHPAAPAWLSHLLWKLNELTGANALVSMHRITLMLLQTANLYVFYVYLKLHHDSKTSLNIIFLLTALPTHIIIFSLYLNDSLLALFLFQFFLCVGFSWHYKNQPFKSYSFALAAGLFLGLAFLTKYTTIVFYCALAASLLFTANKRQFLITKFLVASVVGLILLGINLYWNYYNCQINFVFNFFSRSNGTVIRGMLELFVSLLILLGPLWLLINRHKKEFINNKEGLFSHFFVSAIIVFSVVAIIRGHFGLHWGAGIMFIAILALAEVVDTNEPGTRSYVSWNLTFSALIIIPFLGAFFFIQPNNLLSINELLSKEQQYSINQKLDIADGSLVNSIKEDFPESIIIGTTSYGTTSMLDIAGISNTRFMFNTSKYGRNNDVLYDYRAIDGKDVLFLPTALGRRPENLADNFENIEEITLRGSRGSYNAILGHGFNYHAYKTTTLNLLIENLYNHIPSLQGGCFIDKYR